MVASVRSLYFIVCSTLISILLSCYSWGAVEIYDFDSELQRDRYHELIEVLRCPKCQNQNLAGSDSQIAADLRRELHRLLTEGKTDREIKSFMVDRYGDFVLYKPPLQQSTLVLWLLPLVLFFIGLCVIVFIIKGRKAALTTLSDADNALSTIDQQRLEKLLSGDPGSVSDGSDSSSSTSTKS